MGHGGCTNELRPVRGPLIGVALMLLMGFVEFRDPLQALLPAAPTWACTPLEGQMVTPIVLVRRMKLSPLVLILALMVFGWAWGMIGLLLAVPLLVCIKLVLARWMACRAGHACWSDGINNGWTQVAEPETGTKWQTMAPYPDGSARMNSLATRCLALACIAAPAFAATPPTADQARNQLAEAVTCKRHLTPMQFDAMARMLAPAPARGRTANPAASSADHALDGAGPAREPAAVL